MQRSRYLWILGIALLCLAGILAWKSPGTVMSALAHPEYADSPRATVQHFWNLLDSREMAIAEEMVAPGKSVELQALTQLLEKNPLLSLQKVEFLDTTNPQAVVVRVFWLSPPKDVESQKYVFDLEQYERGWRIISCKRLT